MQWPASLTHATCRFSGFKRRPCIGQPPGVVPRSFRSDHEQGSSEDATLEARQKLVDILMQEAWAGKDGHCASESEDAEIDEVAGEL